MNNTRATYGKLILRTISSTNMIYSVHDLGELVMAPRPRIFNCIFFFKLFSFASPAQKKWRINYAFKPFALIVRWFARLSVRLRLILLPYFSLICIRSGSTTPPHPVRSRLWCLIKQSLQAVEFTGVCSISSSSFNIHLLREIIAKNKKKGERREREKNHDDEKEENGE